MTTKNIAKQYLQGKFPNSSRGATLMGDPRNPHVTPQAMIPQKQDMRITEAGRTIFLRVEVFGGLSGWLFSGVGVGDMGLLGVGCFLVGEVGTRGKWRGRQR